MILKKVYLIYLKSEHHNEGDIFTRMNILKIDWDIKILCAHHKSPSVVNTRKKN